MFRQKGMLSYLMKDLLPDRIFEWIIISILIFAAILVVGAGIAVWPIVISIKNYESSLSSLCKAVFLSNLPLFAVYLMVPICCEIADKESKFQLSFIINLLIGAVANMFILISNQPVLSGVEVPVFLLTLLWLIISFLFSWILTVLPAFLAAIVVKLLSGLVSLIAECATNYFNAR